MTFKDLTVHGGNSMMGAVEEGHLGPVGSQRRGSDPASMVTAEQRIK